MKEVLVDGVLSFPSRVFAPRLFYRGDDIFIPTALKGVEAAKVLAVGVRHPFHQEVVVVKKAHILPSRHTHIVGQRVLATTADSAFSIVYSGVRIPAHRRSIGGVQFTVSEWCTLYTALIFTDLGFPAAAIRVIRSQFKGTSALGLHAGVWQLVDDTSYQDTLQQLNLLKKDMDAVNFWRALMLQYFYRISYVCPRLTGALHRKTGALRLTEKEEQDVRI
jgi:hypothetical protein